MIKKTIQNLKLIRKKLKNKKIVTSGWMQLSNTNLTELMCSINFDCITFDLEHGVFSTGDFPDLFRTAELYNKLPLVRLPNKNINICKQALDAGVGGLIIPNVKNAKELEVIIKSTYLPPKGKRGIGYSRTNQFGNSFNEYTKNKFKPFIVAMIEDLEAVEMIDKILKVKNLDAILIGPYDLSASLKITGQFKNSKFLKTIDLIKAKAKKHNITCGIHVIEPNLKKLQYFMKKGYQFLPYGIDTDIFNRSLSKLFKKN